MFVFGILFACLLTFKQPVMGWRQRFLFIPHKPMQSLWQNYIIANLIGLRHCAKWKSLVILSNLTYTTNMGYILLSLSTCKPLMWKPFNFQIRRKCMKYSFLSGIADHETLEAMGNSLALCLNDKSRTMQTLS